jgi:hypothetical protein
LEADLHSPNHSESTVTVADANDTSVLEKRSRTNLGTDVPPASIVIANLDLLASLVATLLEAPAGLNLGNARTQRVGSYKGIPTWPAQAGLL